MNILIAAGLNNEKKLISKLEPLVSIEGINEIYLVRKRDLSYKKIRCSAPPLWMCFSRILIELYRMSKLFFLCISAKIDVLIGMHFVPHSIYVGFLGLLFHKPYIVAFTEDPKIHGQSSLFWFILKKAQYISVRGSSSLKYLESKGVAKNRIFISPNVYSFTDVKIQHNKKTDILFVAAFVKEKGLEVFVEIISQLKEKIPTVRAVMVGSGPLEKELKERVLNEGLQNNIMIVPEQKNIDKYYQEARIFLLTSKTEGLPMVVVEALHQGLPCVVSNVGDVSDVAITGVNSFVVESGCVSEFVNKTHQLLSNKDLYKEMSVNALKIKEEKEREYTSENVKTIWANVLLGKKDGAGKSCAV
jgi:glycosyltransferase involved in cell wall biosynthesis